MTSRRYDLMHHLVKTGVLIPCEFHDTERVGRCWQDVSLEDVSSVCCSTFRPIDKWDGKITPDLVFDIRYCSGSDYSNSSSVEVSNYRCLTECELADKEWLKTYYGGYGTFGVLIHAAELLKDTDCESCLEYLSGLADYPVLDEQLMSEVEHEWETEAWENWCREDFEKAIVSRFGGDIDGLDCFDIPADKLASLFYTLAERSNTYWEAESVGTGSIIDLDRIVAAATLGDVRALVGL